MVTRAWRVIAGAALGAIVMAAGCGSSSGSVIPGSGGPSHSTTPSDSSTASVSSSADVLGCEPVASPRGIRKSMFDALNRYRVSSGLKPLAYSATLEAAADGHARDMFRRNFFDHTNPDGDGPWERISEAGFCDLRLAAENIAMGYPTVEEVQLGWQNSPGHNANMLDHRPNFAGMGYYAAPDGTQYWAQNFGRSGSFARN